MIKLIPDPTFEHMVRLTVPGQPEPVEVPMTFRHMTVKQVAAWFGEQACRPVADAIGDIVVDWRGVMGEDGKLLEFSKHLLATMLENYPASTLEIVRAWQLGLTESRVKN